MGATILHRSYRRGSIGPEPHRYTPRGSYLRSRNSLPWKPGGDGEDVHIVGGGMYGHLDLIHTRRKINRESDGMDLQTQTRGGPWSETSVAAAYTPCNYHGYVDGMARKEDPFPNYH